MSVFSYSDYKNFLKDFVRQTDRRGLVSELARSMGCSHSYLSQVLNAKPELTPDQAFAAGGFLQFSEDESNYFLLLVLKARSASLSLREYYEAQLKSLKQSHLQLKTVVKKTRGAEVSAADRDFYYSKWTIPALHILTSCKEFQSPAALASRLRLPPKDVAVILDWLLQRGLVKKTGVKYVHSGLNVHLPTESVHNRINHLNWRLKAQESAGETSAIHYTSAFAASRMDLEELRAGLLKFISGQRNEIAKSAPEELFVFCCDFFKPV